LSRPKDNLSASTSSDNLPLGAGETLDIRFSGLTHGRLIDFAANYLDRYTLELYRDQEFLGSLPVPTVPWNGATYGPGGIQARLVKVPVTWSEKGWDCIRVRAKRDGVVGHCLVFADDPLPPVETTKYTAFAKRFEGEHLSQLPGAKVQTVAEAGASGGHARRAEQQWKGWVAYGPYVCLPPGRYRIDFAVRIEDHNAPGPLATIDVLDGGPEPLVKRELSAEDFPLNGKYSVQSLTLNCADDLDFAEFRLWSEGKSAIRLDYVEVIPLPLDFSQERPRAVGRAHD
jgi:hypothetical protein